MKRDTWLIFGAVALAAYLIYELFAKAKEKVEAGADSLAEPIANAWLSFVLPSAVTANAAVRLPNGLVLDVNAIHIVKTPNVEQYTFDYMGDHYELRPRNAITGYYESALVG
jgi:hypothetical protein